MPPTRCVFAFGLLFEFSMLFVSPCERWKRGKSGRVQKSTAQGAPFREGTVDLRPLGPALRKVRELAENISRAMQEKETPRASLLRLITWLTLWSSIDFKAWAARSMMVFQGVIKGP